MKQIITTLAIIAACAAAVGASFAGIAPGLVTVGDPVHTVLDFEKTGALPLFGMAGIIINRQALNDLFTGFKAAFKEGMRDNTTYWQGFATLVPSTTSEEKYGWLGQWPRLRKWIGDRQIKSLALHDYSIKNEPFEASVGVKGSNIKDDNFGLYTPLFKEMGFAADTHPDELLFDLMPRGFTELCFDGQFFFDTDHPVGNEETGISSVSNMQAGAGNPWFLFDNRRPLKPFIFQRREDYELQAMISDDDEAVFMRDEYRYGVDARVNVGFGLWQTAFGSKATLDPTNFQAALEAMMAFKSDEGRPLGVMPDTLAVGPSNRAAALSVIEKALINGGEDNINYKAVEVVVVSWLT